MKQLIKRLIPERVRQSLIKIIFSAFALCFRLLPLKNRALFITVRANGKLLENAKAVYDALDCDKVVFAHMGPQTQKQNLQAYYLLLTSKVVVTDDYLRYLREIKLRKNQKVFQLWHACGAFKKFGLDAPSKLTYEQEKATHAQYDAVAVTSEGCRRHYAKALGIDEEKCIATGLPRTDKLFTHAPDMRDAVYKRHPEFEGKTLYLYCPTFREINGVRVEYNPAIDWDSLSANLAPDEVFVIRRHPMMKYSLINNTYNNIFDLSDESTLELTAASAVIITDYSSVIYDALLLGVPPVFYCPDYKEYDRGFYFSFPDDLPGEMLSSSEELLSAIRRTKENPPVDRIEKFRNGQMGACDGNSSERVAEIIRNWMK